MRSLRRRHAPDERGRGATADAVALVRPLGVVVAHEAIEGTRHGREAREVASREHTGQSSWRIVPCSRSTKPLVQAWRGFVRVWRRPSSRQAASKAPLNSGPPSVSTRRTGQPARWKWGTTTSRRNVAAGAGYGAGRTPARR